jgi:hypothetical protein
MRSVRFWKQSAQSDEEVLFRLASSQPAGSIALGCHAAITLRTALPDVQCVSESQPSSAQLFLTISLKPGLHGFTREASKAWSIGFGMIPLEPELSPSLGALANGRIGRLTKII